MDISALIFSTDRGRPVVGSITLSRWPVCGGVLLVFCCWCCGGLGDEQQQATRGGVCTSPTPSPPPPPPPRPPPPPTPRTRYRVLRGCALHHLARTVLNGGIPRSPGRIVRALALTEHPQRVEGVVDALVHRRQVAPHQRDVVDAARRQCAPGGGARHAAQVLAAVCGVLRCVVWCCVVLCVVWCVTR